MDDIDKANDLADSLREATVERIRREMSQVNTNPICIECDEDIEAERLAKLPSAKRCIICQTDYERRLKTHRQ
jgi:DnaK suppressor protein